MAIRYGNKYFKTSFILDSLKLSEYNALSTTQKEFVRMIISAGEVNFDPNTPVWEALHSFFPDETDTWKDLMVAASQEYSENPP